MIVNSAHGEEWSKPFLDVKGLISVDLSQGTVDVMNEVAKCQSRASLDLIKAVISSIVEINEIQGDSKFLFSKDETGTKLPEVSVKPIKSLTDFQRIRKLPSTCIRDNVLKNIYSGLFYATRIHELEGEATLLLKGLIIHLLLALASHPNDIVDHSVEDTELNHRNEKNRFGSPIRSPEGNANTSSTTSTSSDGITSPTKLQPMPSFGCFSVQWETNPFIINETLVELICVRDKLNQQRGISMMKYTRDVVQSMCSNSEQKSSATLKKVSDCP